MRRLACALSMSLTVLTIATPSAAQIVGQRDYGRVGTANPFLPDSRLPDPPVAAEMNQIHRRIDRLRDSGILSRREARQLHREARAIGHAAYHYSADGYSTSERAELRARTAVLRQEVSRPRP